MSSGDLLKAIKHAEPAVIVFRADYTIEHVSHAALVLFGLPAERFLDQRILDFHGEAAAGRIVETLRLVRESQREVPVSLKFVTRDGQDRCLLVKLLPLLGRGEEQGGVCALLYDITAEVGAGPRLVRIPVTVRDQIELLAPEEIVFVHADNIRSTIRTPAGERQCEMSLAALEKRLSPDTFFRIHRSYLVNVGAVRMVHRDRSECAVTCGADEVRLPVSRDRLHAFMVALGLK